MLHVQLGELDKQVSSWNKTLLFLCLSVQRHTQKIETIESSTELAGEYKASLVSQHKNLLGFYVHMETAYARLVNVCSSYSQELRALKTLENQWLDAARVANLPVVHVSHSREIYCDYNNNPYVSILETAGNEASRLNKQLNTYVANDDNKKSFPLLEEKYGKAKEKLVQQQSAVELYRQFIARGKQIDTDYAYHFGNIKREMMGAYFATFSGIGRASGLSLFDVLGSFGFESEVQLVSAKHYDSRDDAVKAMIAYAQEYARVIKAGETKHNPNYPDTGSNCANFVSQMLVEGGVSMDDTWRVKEYTGRGLWDSILMSQASPYRWGTDIGDHFNDSIEFVMGENGRSFIATCPWTLASDQYEYFSDPDNSFVDIGRLVVDDPRKHECVIQKDISISYNSDIAEISQRVKPGDLLYWDGGNGVTHASIILEVKYGDIFYAEQSGPPDTQYEGEYQKSLTERMRLLHEAGKDKTVHIVPLKDEVYEVRRVRLLSSSLSGSSLKDKVDEK